MTVTIKSCNTCRQPFSEEYASCSPCRGKAQDRAVRYKKSQKGKATARARAERPRTKALNRAKAARHRAKPEVAESIRQKRLSTEGRAAARIYKQAYEARKKNATVMKVTAGGLRAKLAMHGWACWICGGSWVAWDHVKPLNKGGSHALSNLRPACTSCNASKRDTWPFPIQTRRLDPARLP